MGMISVFGIGPGHKDYCLPVIKKEASKQDLLIGSPRHIEIMEGYQGRVFAYQSIKELYQEIEKNMEKNIGILVSGDTGFYSLARSLKKKYPHESITFYPGISSLQYMFAKLCLSYEEAKLVSMHGRECDLTHLLNSHSLVGVLTDRVNSPSFIASLLTDDYDMHIGERLSYDDERIVTAKPSDVKSMTFDSLSVVIVEKR